MCSYMGLTIFTFLCNKSIEIFSFYKTENSVPVEISNFPLLSIPGNHYLSLYEIDYFPDSSVGNLPAMRETWVRSLGWEDALEKGKATHASILSWRIPWTPCDCKESNMTERLSLHFHTFTVRAESNNMSFCDFLIQLA